MKLKVAWSRHHKCW